MELPSKDNIPKVKQMLNNGVMTLLRWYLHGQDACIWLSNSNIALSNAIEAKKFLRLAVNINELHSKENFQPNTFAEISTEPFPQGPATPATTPTNQNLNTLVTINDIASLIAAVSPGTTAVQQTSPLGGNQMKQTGNIINPALLPPLRYNNDVKKVNNMTLTLPKKSSIHSPLPFQTSLLILLEILWERFSTSWMALTKWSPDQEISFISPSWMKRKKRCSSLGCQRQRQKLMILAQFVTGSTINSMDMLSNIASMSINTLTFKSCLVTQKVSHAVMTQIAHCMMSLDSLSCAWENGTLKSTQPYKTSSPLLGQINMKLSLISFTLNIQNMTRIPHS